MVVSMRGFHPTQTKRSDFALVRKNGGADAKPCRLRRCDAEQAHSDAFPLWRFFAYFLIVQKVGPRRDTGSVCARVRCEIQTRPARADGIRPYAGCGVFRGTSPARCCPAGDCCGESRTRTAARIRQVAKCPSSRLGGWCWQPHNRLLLSGCWRTAHPNDKSG